MDFDKEERRSVRGDVAVCLGYGLLIATAFSAWVVTVYLRSGNAPFEKVGTTLWAVILLYFCAAILIAPVVGLLMPLARTTRSGAALLGIVAAIPFYAMARTTLEGFLHRGRSAKLSSFWCLRCLLARPSGWRTGASSVVEGKPPAQT